jgi:Flp pilus assembly pilin Flp
MVKDALAAATRRTTVILLAGRGEIGQGMVEYALILALVTTVAVAGLKLIPGFPVRIFNEVANAF